MSTGLLSRMKLEHAMRQALDKGHMAVYFQPQVHIQSQRIVAAEALLRWTDPDLGVVSPAVFIPLAEESGYVVALDAWVLEQSLKEAAHWLAQGTPVRVSVNVSALEFRQPDFVERLVQVLHASGLPPQWLELELTESILLQDVQEMSMRVHQIAELGVGLVIDDFGTGYSNLSYLKNCRSPRSRSIRALCVACPMKLKTRPLWEPSSAWGRHWGWRRWPKASRRSSSAPPLRRCGVIITRAIYALPLCLRHSFANACCSKARSLVTGRCLQMAYRYRRSYRPRR